MVVLLQPTNTFHSVNTFITTNKAILGMCLLLIVFKFLTAKLYFYNLTQNFYHNKCEEIHLSLYMLK